MAITLRDNTSTNTGKGGELTYSEMDANLESFYYSSSIAGANLLLHTTGSVTHTVDLSGAIAAGAQGVQGIQGIQGIQGRQGPSIQGIQGIQGTTGTQGIQGAVGNPGGSDTQVQFNDGGTSFGGDSGLTYDKTANRLTITAPSSPNRTSPNLLLNSELSDVTIGEVFGVIAANNTTDQFNPATYPASIQFTAEANFSPGVYDAGIRFYTNDAATEKEALRLINTGQNRLPQYGAGTFTGTAAKWLAVDSSGNVIEENAPSGGSKDYTRSSEVTHTVHTKVTSVAYQLQAVASTQGYLVIEGLSYPGATVNANTVSYLLFNVNDNTGTNREKTLKYLCKWTSNSITGNSDSATITVSDTGASGWLAQFNINGVVEISTGIYRVAVSGGSNITIGSSFGSVLDVSFDSFALIPLQDNEWNRILIEQYSPQDPSGQKHGIILQAPSTWQAFGTRGIVEVKCGAQEQLTVWYAKNISQGTTGTYSYNIPTNIKSAKHIQQTATVGLSTQDSVILTVGRSNTAILEVMSVQLSGTAPGLSVLGVDLITGY